MHPHLARYMGQDDMSILELHPKHRIWQGFRHGSLYFDNIFFGHVLLRSFLRLKCRLRLAGSRS